MEGNQRKVNKLQMVQNMMEVPKFNQGDVPDAAVREGVDGLALRCGEEGMLRTFVDTTNVERDSRCEPPIVNEVWYAVCQAIYKGVEEVE